MTLNKNKLCFDGKNHPQIINLQIFADGSLSEIKHSKIKTLYLLEQVVTPAKLRYSKRCNYQCRRYPRRSWNESK